MPLSLHGQLEGIRKKKYDQLRLDFSIEDERQTNAVIEYYVNCMTKEDGISSKEIPRKEFPYKEFTNGHYKRGVM